MTTLSAHQCLLQIRKSLGSICEEALRRWIATDRYDNRVAFVVSNIERKGDAEIEVRVRSINGMFSTKFRVTIQEIRPR